MSEADQIDYIEKCLHHFEYPLIQAMTPDEIGDIFKPANRSFLISWIFKKMDFTLSEIDDLSELVYQHGFCGEKQHKAFMAAELPPEEELNILYRIFTFLNDIIGGSTENRSFSMETVENLQKTNLNLFSDYGPLVTLTPMQRQTKIEEYKDEIKNLKLLLQSQETEAKYDLQVNLQNELTNAMENLKLALPDFKANVAVVKNQTKNNENTIKFSENLMDLLEKSKNNLLSISEFAASCSQISNFGDDCKTLNPIEVDKIDENLEMLETLSEIVKDL